MQLGNIDPFYRAWPRTRAVATTRADRYRRCVEAEDEDARDRSQRDSRRTGEQRKAQKILDVLRTKGTRGLSVEEINDLPAVVSDRPSVDLEVYFDYDSSAITTAAKPTLTSLGKALQAKELKGENFLLAGHTDGTGNPNYNQDLSERRAAAVKQFLIENFGVSESELVATGFGQTRLKIPSDPAAAQNRRVQVINVGQ